MTATIINDVCFMAWVGDSKAILVRRETDAPDSKLKILELTKDHTCMMAKVYFLFCRCIFCCCLRV